MAHGLLLAIPSVCPFPSFSERDAHAIRSGWQTLLEQYERDDNVQTLLRAVHDAFDFAHHEDTLKSIKPQSEQARILTLILQDVCSCCDFIRSYADDSQFCTLSSSCFIWFGEHNFFQGSVH